MKTVKIKLGDKLRGGGVVTNIAMNQNATHDNNLVIVEIDDNFTISYGNGLHYFSDKSSSQYDVIRSMK